ILTSPRVGNTPTRQLAPEGKRIEFDVSVPVPIVAKLAAVAVAVPPEDPPGLTRQLYALPGRPPAELIVVSAAAKSGRLLWPRITAPAALSLSTIAASFDAFSSWPGIRYPSQPFVVTRPFTLVFPFTTIGTPQSRPGLKVDAAPFLAASSEA